MSFIKQSGGAMDFSLHNDNVRDVQEYTIQNRASFNQKPTTLGDEKEEAIL